MKYDLLVVGTREQFVDLVGTPGQPEALLSMPLQDDSLVAVVLLAEIEDY